MQRPLATAAPAKDVTAPSAVTRSSGAGVIDRQPPRVVGVLVAATTASLDAIAAVDADQLSRLGVVGVLGNERLLRPALRAVDLELRPRSYTRPALLADADGHL